MCATGQRATAARLETLDSQVRELGSELELAWAELATEREARQRAEDELAEKRRHHALAVGHVKGLIIAHSAVESQLREALTWNEKARADLSLMTTRNRELNTARAESEAARKRAETGLDMCSVVHQHNVKLKARAEAAEQSLRALREAASAVVAEWEAPDVDDSRDLQRTVSALRDAMAASETEKT